VVDQFPAPTKMVLSPAAQAVLDATLGEGCVSWRDRRRIAAAALRAAADQVVPEDLPSTFVPGAPRLYAMQRRDTRRQLLTLATELEAH
jgi:hypothetical protein